ncbi:MAG TPA: CorA family divalent cation transporter [Chloroflexia bacterium]|nr:CorA family divalent cation transporter [Chloroflexia bacterium]
MAIKAYLFDAQGVDHPEQLEHGLTNSVGDAQLLWVNATDPSDEDLGQISSAFKIRKDVLKSVLRSTTQPRIDTSDDYVHITVLAPLAEGRHFKASQLDLFAGPNYVIALHTGAIDFLDSFNEQTSGDTKLGELDSGTFLVALLNRFINRYFELLDELGAEVDKLDERALNNRSGQTFLTRIVQLRHQVSEVRWILSPHRQVFATLAGPDFGKVAFLDSTADFAGLLDRLEKALDGVENTREMVIGSFEVFTTVTAHNTNQSVRLLTIITVVIGLSGVIAGVMGMNFTDWDFFHTGAFGFLVVIAGIVLLAVATLALAKWRNLF